MRLLYTSQTSNTTPPWTDKDSDEHRSKVRDINRINILKQSDKARIEGAANPGWQKYIRQ